jgi:phosphoglycerol transferase
MFGITVLPYFFYGKPDIRNHKITHAIRRYANIVVPVSLFYLFLFSIYKSRGMVAALGYLAESFNLKYMTVVSLLNGIIIFTDSKLKKKNITVSFFTKNVPRYLIATILVFWFLVFASLEFTEMYAIIPIEQFMFHLAYPVTNGNFSMVRQAVMEPVVNSFCITLLCTYLLSVKINMQGNSFFLPFKRFGKITRGIAAIFPFLGIIYLALVIGLPHYLFAPKEEPSRFYEENYISPVSLNVSFPEKKRNLIVIIVESLETGFLKTEEGGAFSEDLMPEIAVLAKNNIN